MVVREGLGLPNSAVFHDSLKLPHKLALVSHLASISDSGVFKEHLEVFEDFLAKAVGKLVAHLLQPEGLKMEDLTDFAKYLPPQASFAFFVCLL